MTTLYEIAKRFCYFETSKKVLDENCSYGHDKKDSDTLTFISFSFVIECDRNSINQNFAQNKRFRNTFAFLDQQEKRAANLPTLLMISRPTIVDQVPFLTSRQYFLNATSNMDTPKRSKNTNVLAKHL